MLVRRRVETCKRRVLADRRERVVAARPLFLILEQHVHEAEEGGALHAVGGGGGAQRELVERVVPEHEAGAAAVAPFRLHLRQGVAVEGGAVPACEGGILQAGDRSRVRSAARCGGDEWVGKGKTRWQP